MQKYSDCPNILKEFLVYHENIKGQSQLTISEYYLDLRMFLRFVKLMRNDMPITTKLEDISIKEVANLLGFSSEFYFSKFCSKHTQLSPKQYRIKFMQG